ncbi:UDP-N-acetylmuramoyl-L-alanyl-D-glutamate--2,6-diaminopimelate ligase [Bacterioplanoides sp.]|uniref:UDP-N-acetylmuramoyl-L-alanyl-D-glutamate--2, 6-diaminopimelate ligase n=1 Tax=Bacterioplanoides sp. TaxID=2066072 RepID=UPI003B00DFFB
MTITTMKLSQLTQGNPYIPPEWDREIKHIRIDSRDVAEGDVFIARSGSQQDGRAHILDAVKNGAVAVLADGEIAFECVGYELVDSGVPVFSAPGLAQQIVALSEQRYPQSAQMPLIAVTGTNGKSSVTQYIAQLTTTLNKAAGLLGTLGNGVWPNLEATRNTTPDITVVKRSLYAMAEQKADLAALEVSSHGLEQGRVTGLAFHTAIMTNLTQDHLDYHGDMDSYFAAKAKLFRDYPLQYALINSDDEYGQRLLNESENSAEKIYSYGRRADSDIYYSQPNYESGWLTSELTTPWGQGTVKLPLIGDFNMANAVAAITALCLQDFDFSELLAAAATLNAVDGRMALYRRVVNAVNNDTPSAVTQLAVVDFAHTPDALTNVMQALKGVATQQALVFGCGGDRDRSKRSLMADVAVSSEAEVWLTDDNPRTEDPQQIFADVLTAKNSEQFHQQHDRTLAITEAVNSTAELVVIAGKGHENYQEVAGIKHPYSDEAVLLKLGFEKAGGQYA